jgi:Protein of unknown function (DUF2510)
MTDLLTRTKRHTKAATQQAIDAAAPGWFTDPSSGAHERFWTGDVWTGLVRERDLGFAETVPGVNRTLFEKNVPTSKFSSRRMRVTTTSIRWGRWEIPTSEITSVWHWIEESSNAVNQNPANAWHKLVFEAENRVSGLRVKFDKVGGSEARQTAWDAYRALVSVSTTIVAPRIAAEYLQRLTEGKEVKIGGLKMTSRGVVQRHVDPRRASMSAHWNDLTLLVDCDGRPFGLPNELARVGDGSIMHTIPANTKNGPVLPLLLWLAKDKFETKPIVLRERAYSVWDDHY